MPAQKGFVVSAVVIIGTLIIFTLGFLSLKANFSQTAKNQEISKTKDGDPYFGWKTYEASEHKFTIRYPDEWFVKEYGDFAANFVTVDPKLVEASPSAVKVRYSRSSDEADIREFEKIFKLSEGKKILEPLDVKSEVTKLNDFRTGTLNGINFQIERTFSALTGPRKEFTHVYMIKKGNTVFKFSNSALKLEDQVKFNEQYFVKIISSLEFQK